MTPQKKIIGFLFSGILSLALGCEEIDDHSGDGAGGAGAVAGEGGHGLKGTYYDSQDFTDPVLERVDAVVNFDWGRGSPDPKVAGDNFSVRWLGFVKAEHSETYTFYTIGDDGIRLYVDDKPVVDDWSNHGARERSGTVSLKAGQLHSLKLEYYEDGGGAVAKLLWSSKSRSKQVIPEERLYTELPSGGPVITASGEHPQAGETKEKAFDGDTKTKWLTFSDSAWIQYDFAGDERKVITQYSITSANDCSERDPKNWKLLGSNDGAAFTTVDERSNESFSSRFQKKTYAVRSPASFKMYRLDISSNSNPPAANATQLAEIELTAGGVVDNCPNDPGKTEPGECGCGVPEGTCGGEISNVALGKETRQSSIAYRGDSFRAVDGNTSGNYGDSSVTHTDFQAAPWWQVDLGAVYDVERVVLFNRTDCCGNRLSDFHVDYLDKDGRMIATKKHLGEAGVKTEIALAVSSVRTVRVQLDGTNALSLAEVQVWSGAQQITDTDGDGTADSEDGCPADPGKVESGACGCGVPDIDANKNGIFDCNETECSSTLGPDEMLYRDQFLCSPDGRYEFGLTTAGRLVFLENGNSIWDAGFSGATFLAMQGGDGHLVAYRAPGDPLWGSGTVDTAYKNAVSLVVQNSGRAELRWNNVVIWYVDKTGAHEGDDIPQDLCPSDPKKTEPGVCGCGTPDIDSNDNGVYDCVEGEEPPDDVPGFGNPPLRCTPAGFTNSDSTPTNVGPMVGHTTHDSALIWAHFPNASKIEVEYWRPDVAGGTTTVRTLKKDSTGESSRVVLSGLSADTIYVYRLLVSGKEHDGCYGWFKTMPTKYRPTKFKYVFGSGIRYQMHAKQPVWEKIAEYEPDMLILNGDNIYLSGQNDADYNYSQKITRHRKQRYGQVSDGKTYSYPWFAGILRTMPIYSIWDDHDYGPNNSTSAFSLKNESRRGFMEMWGNPSHGQSNQGVYTRFSRGDVEFFLVDNRWFRTSSAYLGNAQMQWLKAGLLDAHKNGAKFKIIVHGGTLHGWLGEYSAERNDLLNFLASNRIGGVIFHDGDSHWNCFNPYPNAPNGNAPHYKAVGLMSSGLSYNARYVSVEVNTTLSNPTITFELHGDGRHRTDGAKGQLILQSDGRLKHVVIGSNGGFRIPDEQGHLKEAIISPW